MGVSRHDRAGVQIGHVKQPLLQAQNQPLDVSHLYFQVHAQVERDLVVAAACGVQAFARLAQAFRQHLLDEHVDVLRRRVKRKRARFQVVQNALQLPHDLVAVLLRDNPARAKHGRVGHTALYIFSVHAGVERQRRIEIVHLFIRLFLEPARP